MRALVGAIAPAEHALRAEGGTLERQLSAAETESSHRRWDVLRRRVRLAKAVGTGEGELPAGPLATEFVRAAARDQLNRVAEVESGSATSAFETLRAEYEDARLAVEKLAQDLREVATRIPETERLVARIRGELPGISFSLQGAQQPVCPVCEVPIDRVLAEGCKLSHKVPDLATVTQRRQQCLDDIEAETARVRDDKKAEGRISSELTSARKRTDTLRMRLVAAERARDERREAWYAARRAIDDVERLAELYALDESATASAEKLRIGIAKKREEIAAQTNAPACSREPHKYSTRLSGSW